MASLGKEIVAGVKANLKGAWETISNTAKAWWQNVKRKVNEKKLVDGIMWKHYPPYWVTWESMRKLRRKETKDLVKQSKPWVARENLEKIHTKFEKDNPEYKRVKK